MMDQSICFWDRLVETDAVLIGREGSSKDRNNRERMGIQVEISRTRDTEEHSYVSRAKQSRAEHSTARSVHERFIPIPSLRHLY